MPYHGDSAGAPAAWTMDDCAGMLLYVLDALDIERSIAVGHSWGSMTILRAAVRSPARSAAVGLCNMPLASGNRTRIMKYHLQATMLPFRSFYTRQAAKALYAPASLAAHPEFVTSLQATMGRLSNREVRQVDMAVVIDPDDGFAILRRLTVPALALKGEHDYVPAPPGLDLTIVPGGHMISAEAPDAVQAFVRRVIALGEEMASRSSGIIRDI